MKIVRFLFSLKGLLLMFGIFIGLILATNLMSFSASEEEIMEAFKSMPYQPEHHFIKSEAGNLHYITVGDPSKPHVLLIHGSPGSWDVWLDILTVTDFLEHYYALAIDRPGYNKTTLEAKYSLQQQSGFLQPLLKEHCHPCIVAGHSYGGAMAVQTALDYPGNVASFVSIAGTVADSLQEPRFYNYILRYSPLQWIIAPEFMVSNQEMMALEEDLPKMELQLPSYTGKAAFVQGNADMLVSPGSPFYLKAKLTRANTRIWVREKMNHFVIWSDKDLVMEALKWTSTSK
ncbi:MAG: alpha/beta fold hydrolase [Owenweeksia sp.]